MKIHNAIIRIESYGILVSEFAAGGKVRNGLKTIDLLKAKTVSRNQTNKKHT